METLTDMIIGRYIGTSATTDTDISVLPILVNIGRYRYANPASISTQEKEPLSHYFIIDLIS